MWHKSKGGAILARQTHKQSSVKKETVAPKRFVYSFFLALARALFWFLYRIRYETDPQLTTVPGPYFIVGNHVSYLDPIICAMAMRKEPIRFVSGQEIANTKMLRPLLKQFAIIEIKPFRVNFSTTKEIITSIQDGLSVALYPETQRSIAGDITPFGPATAKLIKHLKAPVVSVICHGGYLGWPRWAPSLRPGKMEVETKLLFTAEETQNMDVDSIQKRLVKAMYADDYTWQTTRRRPARFFSRKPAEQLSAVCHWCPNCDRPLAMRSERNKLFCAHCDFSLRVDASGFFSASPGSIAPFDHPLDYARWQQEKTEQHIKKGGHLESLARLEFLENVGQGQDPDHRELVGKLVLNSEGLRFIPDGEMAPIELLVGDSPSLYCGTGQFVNLPQGDIIWRAYPEEEGYVVLLTDYSRLTWIEAQDFNRYLEADDRV